MGIWTPIADIIILLAVALLLGILMERLKQNALIGYLLSGVLLGPAGIGLVGSVRGDTRASRVGGCSFIIHDRN